MAGTFTCSIDDGHPSDMRIAELLQKHGLNATFFIPIKNSENYPVLRSAQVRELGANFEIGSHTYDHCYLAKLNPAQARYQVIAGKRKLEDSLGGPVYGFCYPGGKYHRDHINLVKSAGFHYARTTENLCFSLNKSRFEIPTTCQFYPHDKSVYVRNYIRKLHWQERSDALLIMLGQRSWIDRMYALFDHAIEHDLIFHLWTHSHNLDDLQLWDAVDGFFNHVSKNVASTDRLNNHQLVKRHYQVQT